MTTANRISLSAFRAAKKLTTVSECGTYADGFTMDAKELARAAYLYPGDLVIEVTEDGKYYLIIHNFDWEEEKLDGLEEKLYEFYVEEIMGGELNADKTDMMPPPNECVYLGNFTFTYQGYKLTSNVGKSGPKWTIRGPKSEFIGHAESRDDAKKVVDDYIFNGEGA